MTGMGRSCKKKTNEKNHQEKTRFSFLDEFLPITSENQIDNLISFFSSHKCYWDKKMDDILKSKIPSRLYNYYRNQSSIRLGRGCDNSTKFKKSLISVSSLKYLVKNNRDYSKPTLGDQLKKSGIKCKRAWLTFISVPMGGSNKKK